jgi:DNA-binding beta-propeller fold protein YncE
LLLVQNATAAGTPHVIATIGLGDQPEGVGVNPTTTTIYVANTSDNTVSVIKDIKGYAT